MAEEHATAGNSRFELAVLGAALTSDEAWDVISRGLSESDFLNSSHARLYDEIVRAEDEGRLGDVSLIAQALVDGGDDNGYELIADATTAAAPTGTLRHYMDDLRGRSKARKAAALSAAFTQQARAAQTDPSALASLLSQHEEALRELSTDGEEEPWVSVSSLMHKVEQGDARTEASVPSGFPDLDRMLQGGFRPGQMVTLAARTSMGKSTIVVDIARYASLRRDVPGLHLSLEMTAEEIGGRIASAEAAIPLSNVIKDELTDAERAKVADLAVEMDEMPLRVLDVQDASWSAVRAQIISAHRRHGIAYAVIDTLQLVTFDESRSNSRQEEIGRISRSCKRLAKQLGIVIFSVVQLNRGAEQRSGSVPQMSDIRESGDIEQDSDVVILLHRPDYYDKMSDRAGEADVIVAKQRNGPTGTVVLAFQGHYSRFMSLSHESPEAPYSYPEA